VLGNNPHCEERLSLDEIIEDCEENLSVDEMIEELDLRLLCHRAVSCYNISHMEEARLDAVLEWLINWA
jgi:hypothetical protein